MKPDIESSGPEYLREIAAIKACSKDVKNALAVIVWQPGFPKSFRVVDPIRMYDGSETGEASCHECDQAVDTVAAMLISRVKHQRGCDAAQNYNLFDSINMLNARAHMRLIRPSISTPTPQVHLLEAQRKHNTHSPSSSRFSVASAGNRRQHTRP